MGFSHCPPSPWLLDFAIDSNHNLQTHLDLHKSDASNSCAGYSLQAFGKNCDACCLSTPACGHSNLLIALLPITYSYWPENCAELEFVLDWYAMVRRLTNF
jgi:hypothetical protein